jgi:Mce-associated membrane protein
MAKHADAIARQLNGSSPGEEEDASAAEETNNDVGAGSTDDQQTEERNDDPTEVRVRQRSSGLLLAIAVGVAVVVALGGAAGWFWYRTYEDRQTQAQRDQFVEAAHRGALSLTTIEYTKVDADIQRILDSSTGDFHDDFQKRSQPFSEVVKQAQATSEGTVTAEGLESREGDQAQVLVALSVKMSNAGAPEQKPRAWRMRINVQRVGGAIKMSGVQFVP